MEKVWTVVPAAGIGRRMGQGIPKQYLKINEATVLEHTLNRLFSFSPIKHIHLVLQAGDQFAGVFSEKYGNSVSVVNGGEERADSVFNALQEIKGAAAIDDWVLVHDAARPCIRLSDIEKLINKVEGHFVGGILGAPVADTLKRVAENGEIDCTVSRSRLWRAYTPQVFRFGLLFNAMADAMQQGLLLTDEASALESHGYHPLMVEGHSDNLKITRPQDLSLAEMYLKNQKSE